MQTLDFMFHSVTVLCEKEYVRTKRFVSVVFGSYGVHDESQLPCFIT